MCVFGRSWVTYHIISILFWQLLQVYPSSFTLQLVATNMIAEGRVWDGVQLLCLIDKVLDACKYLQSDNQWDASLWLAKCRLSPKASCTNLSDMKAIFTKFIYPRSTGRWPQSTRRTARRRT